MPPDRTELVIQRTPWELVAIGAFPLLGGVVFSLVSLVLWFAPGVEMALRVMFTLFGMVMLPLGLCAVLGRCGTTIDRQQRLVTRWWGLGKPLWRTVDSYEGADHVELSIGRPRKTKQQRFAVWLSGPGVQIPIFSARYETQPRAIADQVAQFLQLELHDQTSRKSWDDADIENIVRQPDEIGVSVGERIRSGQEQLALPPRPADMLTTIEPTIDGFRILFPRQGLSGPLLFIGLMSAIPVSFLAIMPQVAAYQMKQDMRDAFVANLFACCGTSLALGVGALVACLVIGSATVKGLMEVSPREFYVKGGLWSQAISASQIEEVRVEGEGGNWLSPCFIHVRSNATSARYGSAKLSRAEGEYLAALIKAVVAKDTTPSAQD